MYYNCVKYEFKVEFEVLNIKWDDGLVTGDVSEYTSRDSSSRAGRQNPEDVPRRQDLL